MTFCHLGDLGDLVSHLSVMKNLGPFDLVLYRNKKVPIREPWTAEKVESVKPFLLQQSYINSVSFSHSAQGRILDGWRQVAAKQRPPYSECLADSMADFLEVPRPNRNETWLTTEPNRISPCCINRTSRYHGDGSVFREAMAIFSERVFLGTEAEHQVFEKEFGRIEHYRTPTLTEFAATIAGSEVYVGGQSSGFWNAVGIGVPTVICEQHKNKKGNCYWEREGVLFDNILINTIAK